ncbi:MAG: ABC transporter substrate-binding protein [Alphaproteobacteria bacterium]|jgi:hypothetical protein|nr:ABC transporter substrate-binding protein [Alphaproteobacteria bacterium]
MFRFAPFLAAGMFSLAATGAYAQDTNLCGGVGANGQWLGGDEASSDISRASDYLEQMALVLLRNEYVALFTLSEPGEVRIEAEGRGSGDTVIDLRDAAGNLVISDDDSGGNGASRAETFLDPGTYCVSLRSFDGSPLTGFVRVGRPEHAALTAGGETPSTQAGGECDLSQAAPITLGQPVTNSVDGAPFYSLALDQATAISLTAENRDADPVLVLYDGQGNWLAENDDFDGLNSRIDMADPLAPGQYCIALRALSDSGLPVTTTAKVYDPEEVMMTLYARGEASPPLDGSYPVTTLGEISTRLREDVNVGGDAAWYSVDVFEGGLLLIEAIAQGQGDPVLTVYDDLGRQVAYNDDHDGSLDSMITARIQPGTYLVAVRQLDNSMQGVIRLVFERYVPARPE